MDNNQYPVYPEDDGYDRFRNPYSPVWTYKNFITWKKAVVTAWQAVSHMILL